MLPRVHEVSVIRDWDDMHLWRITHALGVFRGDYVVRLQCQKESKNSYFMRFRVDTRYPRDVKDGWGNVRIVGESPTRTRLHYQARAVLYPGILRWLFSSKIETAMLVVPNRARNYVHRRMQQAANTK